MIERVIHAVRILWKQHTQEEDWRFLLIDAQNVLMRITAPIRCGRCNTSGPVERGLHLIATTTGPPWWPIDAHPGRPTGRWRWGASLDSTSALGCSQ